MKYTEEKWILQYPKNVGDFEITLDRVVSIASIHDAYDDLEDQESRAKLIAAAPELLEALIILQKRLEMLINLTPTGEKRNQLTEDNIKALLAIKKAIE